MFKGALESSFQLFDIDCVQYKHETNAVEAKHKVYKRNQNIVVFNDDNLSKSEVYAFIKESRDIDGLTPILLLSQNQDHDYIMRCYEYGIDDYIMIPYNVNLVYWKLRTWAIRVCKELSSDLGETLFKIGDYQFDYYTQTLRYLNELPLKLSQTESEVMRLLVANPKILTIALIYKHVWPHVDLSQNNADMVKVYISKFRSYFKKDSSIRIINYKGIGYRLIY